MADKDIVLITGANTGIGYEVVKALWTSPKAYDIILGSRTVSKGEDAIKTLKSEHPDSASSVSVMQADVSSDESLEKLVKDVETKYGRLDALINNAGAGYDLEIVKGNMTIREGWNKSWDTNVAGTQVLTTLAMPLLLKSKNARLLFVTSGTSSLQETFDTEGMMARLNQSPDAGWPKDSGVNPVICYRSTKTGLNMMFRQWVRILKNDNVKVFNISPGFLATGLAGVGKETLKKMGARDPSVGGIFIKDVIEGKRDQDVGMTIRESTIQPW